MAMAAARLRSSVPLLRKILTVDSVSSSTQRSSAFHRALICPSFVNPELPRNYATASEPKGQKVKVPLMMSGVSGNYASALYIAAVKANTLEKVEYELLDLVEASKKSLTFSQFMKDVTVPAETRKNAMTEICSEAGLSDITKNFLVVLAEDGLLSYMDRIAKRFTELTREHRGEVKAIVTSVIPLPPQEEKELKETLQHVVGQEKKINLEQKIDPSILGGLVVQFGEKLFDMSIRTRARQMERFLRNPIDFDTL